MQVVIKDIQLKDGVDWATLMIELENFLGECIDECKIEWEKKDLHNTKVIKNLIIPNPAHSGLIPARNGFPSKV